MVASPFYAYINNPKTLSISHILLLCSAKDEGRFGGEKTSAFEMVSPRHTATYILYNILYYQHKALYIINSAGEYTLARDEIQGRISALDDMHRTSRGDDIPSLRLGYKKRNLFSKVPFL